MDGSWLALHAQPSYTPSTGRRPPQPMQLTPSSPVWEGGTLNCAPSAVADAGNGWDGGKRRGVGVMSEHEGEGAGHGRNCRGSAQERVPYSDEAGAAEYPTAGGFGGRGRCPYGRDGKA